MSLYTWNARTGVLDGLASRTGLEFVGAVIKPGRWVADQTTTLWDRYVYLVDLRQTNDALRQRIDTQTLELAALREQAAEARRLRRLLDFAPPMGWAATGARIVAQRLGPNAVLETLIIDKGTLGGADVNTPVATPEGVVGRVLRSGFSSSTVLLVTDQNSRIPVIGSDNRSTGILTGQGPGAMLELRYMPLNAPLNEGEILLTSGLAEIFPKGLPIARVVSIEHSDISLFLTVQAEPLVDLQNLEELLLLSHMPRTQETAPGVVLTTNATAPDNLPAP